MTGFIPNPDAADKQALKAKLREEYGHKRQVIPADLQDTTRWKAINHARTLISKTKAEVIALYYPIHEEIDLRPLAEELWQDNLTVCLPRVAQRDHGLIFNVWTKDDPLEPDLLGISCASGAEIVPSLLFIPALGYSKDGFRLGYGGGFYDRTLKDIGGHCQSVNICQTELEIDTFPAEYHDQPADYVITGKELITCRL